MPTEVDMLSDVIYLLKIEIDENTSAPFLMKVEGSQTLQVYVSYDDKEPNAVNAFQSFKKANRLVIKHKMGQAAFEKVTAMFLAVSHSDEEVKTISFRAYFA